jgi:hypothetical protein
MSQMVPLDTLLKASTIRPMRPRGTLWVSYDRGELISWVPNALISLAQEGIDANPVDCIHWADSTFTLKPF